MGIIGLLSGMISVLLFFLRKSDEKQTTESKHKSEQDEFNEHLANGDALGLSTDFERVRNEIRNGDNSSRSRDRQN